MATIQLTALEAVNIEHQPGSVSLAFKVGGVVMGRKVLKPSQAIDIAAQLITAADKADETLRDQLARGGQR